MNRDLPHPSAPFRTAPHPNVAVRKGQPSTPSAPLSTSPPLGGGGGVRKGRETKRGKCGKEPKTLPHPQSGQAEQVLPDEGFWPAVPIAEVAEEWVILRCASASTIELADDLRDEGLIAWVPIIRVQKRLPRRRKTELIVRPLLPSFVFVAKDHAFEAIDLASRGQVPQCKWFLFNGGEVTIPGIQLTQLHEAQIRGTLRKCPLVPGDRVEILANLLYLVKALVLRGPFKGDSYEVELEGQRQRFIFPGFLLRKLSI